MIPYQSSLRATHVLILCFQSIPMSYALYVSLRIAAANLGGQEMKGIWFGIILAIACITHLPCHAVMDVFDDQRWAFLL